MKMLSLDDAIKAVTMLLDCEDDTDLIWSCDVINNLKHAPSVEDVEPTQKWISVKDRLPEGRTNPHTLDFEPVVCATTFGDVRVYKYGQRLGHTEAHFWNWAGIMDEYVTHWQNMPEMPKEEKRDE